MQRKRNQRYWGVLFIAALTACSSDDHDDGYRYSDAGQSSSPPDASTSTPPHVDASSAPPPAWQDAGAPDAATMVTGPKGYIGVFGDGNVAVFDVQNARVVKTLPVTAPDGLVITPDNKKVYVSSTDTGTVKVIETVNDTIAGSIDVGAKPAGLAVSADGRYLVVAAGGANEAVIVDTSNDTVVRHIPVGLAHASCITADGHWAYVGSQVTSAPAIDVIDLTSNAAPTTIAVDKPPRMLACESDRIYFTAVGLDAVEVLDPATGKTGTPIATGGSPHDVRAAVPGKTELTVSQTAGDLEFIDVPTATVVNKVTTGKLAHWIALNKDHSFAYITNEGDNNVAVVDLANPHVVLTVPVGTAPRKMAIQQL